MRIEDVLNSREISILLWVGVALTAMMFSKSIRSSLWHVIKTLFNKTFLIIYLLLASYLTGVISLLYKLNLWDYGDLKDTVFWLFSVGFVLIFNITKANSSNYFKTILKEGIKWTVILEFVVGFYSFSLLTEIVIVPLLVIIGVTQAVSERDSRKRQVTNILANIMSVIGLVILTYALYMTVVNYETFFTIDTLSSFLLPIIITTLFIPFIYLLALYSAYEMLFLRLDFMTTEKKKVKQAKRHIKVIANLNLDRVNKVKNNFEKRVFYEDVNLRLYLQNLIRNQ